MPSTVPYRADGRVAPRASPSSIATGRRIPTRTPAAALREPLRGQDGQDNHGRERAVPFGGRWCCAGRQRTGGPRVRIELNPRGRAGGGLGRSATRRGTSASSPSKATPAPPPCSAEASVVFSRCSPFAAFDS